MMQAQQRSDARIAAMSAQIIAKKAEELSQERLPLPWGKLQHYRAYIPERTPDDIYERETLAEWFWYAAELDAFIATLASTPFVEFVQKKKQKS